MPSHHDENNKQRRQLCCPEKFWHERGENAAVGNIGEARAASSERRFLCVQLCRLCVSPSDPSARQDDGGESVRGEERVSAEVGAAGGAGATGDGEETGNTADAPHRLNRQATCQPWCLNTGGGGQKRDFGLAAVKIFRVFRLSYKQVSLVSELKSWCLSKLQNMEVRFTGDPGSNRPRRSSSAAEGLDEAGRADLAALPRSRAGSSHCLDLLDSPAPLDASRGGLGVAEGGSANHYFVVHVESSPGNPPCECTADAHTHEHTALPTSNVAWE